jgi:hypothetical protein
LTGAMATALSGHAATASMPTPTRWRRCPRGHGTRRINVTVKPNDSCINSRYLAIFTGGITQEPSRIEGSISFGQ